eukprot:7919766-Pyramimonas_sp.AAC.1
MRPRHVRLRRAGLCRGQCCDGDGAYSRLCPILHLLPLPPPQSRPLGGRNPARRGGVRGWSGLSSLLVRIGMSGSGGSNGPILPASSGPP